MENESKIVIINNGKLVRENELTNIFVGYDLKFDELEREELIQKSNFMFDLYYYGQF